MEKMIYLMNVDWNWIKQRPHFLAEELSKEFDLTVVNQKRYSRKNLQNRTFNGNLFEMKVIPRIDRYKYLKEINVYLKRKYLKKLILNLKPDYIYVTMPEQVKWIPKIYSGKIIYDCMDDHIGLTRSDYKKIELSKNENALIKKANYIFISSKFLLSTLTSRYGKNIDNKCTVVRNGFNGRIISISDVQTKNKNLVISYFGTISDWFDFDVILKSLDNNKNIEYRLYGPIDRNIEIPKHERLKYLGLIEHENLYETTKDSDAFIMPFILDDSIRAVDPVKLYEYINFNKNIICVDYAEVRRFDKFCDFYSDYEEYNSIIMKYIKNRKVKYSNQDRIEFLKINSWGSRANQIINILENNK